ncbi:hypothetical protein BU25DRAFT_406645 [Macroventuria anomochaeta]|uniref:Uncharacterized protein n=1 Tax=Macroventuria anomochaeta TaxID=301207 RepID=A0ACB6SG99_9PLEO|nr:uncharacterized protein BU25DRAFT_406645 [Macroventuria anomochaeta]KAF2632122.1 hypothetical protein BU25DRAFT_406645 [Macroventuria anomochaeta]
MSLFKHRPLNLHDKEILLLRLDGNEDESSPICVTLQHAKLWEVEYNALSYE